MNNINNNITKFNGQYLKCVVSNYTSTKNYLANSGSLIIIQPKSGKLNDIDWENAYKNGDIHRNYVYLGNEFLASGFGFGSQYILEKAEQIVNSYDDDINNLKEEDKTLNKKIDDKVQELYNELEKYVKINGGKINDTIVTIGGYNIKTKDIILHGEEAKYQNLEVNDIKISLNGNTSDNSTFFMPIGSLLKQINVEINISKNDSGGLEKLEILHKFNDTDPLYEGTILNYDLDTEITIDSDYKVFRIFYSKQLDENFIIDSYKDNIIKSIYLYVKKTPIISYKYYPGIFRKFGFKIISSENSIKSNIINLNKQINIRPQYYARYSENGVLNDNGFNKSLPLNSFIDYDKTDIVFKVNENINNVYIAIPSNFSVSKIFILNNYSEKYNWTGAVGIMRNRKMKCIDTNPVNPYYINYDIYCLKSNNGFIENYSIEMNIIYDSPKDIINVDGDYDNLPTLRPSNNDTNLNINNFDVLNDEEFNEIYWVNYKKLNSSGQDIIDKLYKTQVNGVKKINSSIFAQYNVTLTVINGTISSDSVQTVMRGGSVSWTVTPNTGYQLPSSISGATISGNTVTVSNVILDKTITINCESINDESIYWYVGTIKPTSLSDSWKLTSYPTEWFYVNDSDEMAYVYALTDNNHNVVMYDAGTNWIVAMNEVDMTSIPGYKIYKTEGMCAVGGSTKIVIS